MLTQSSDGLQARWAGHNQLYIGWKLGTISPGIKWLEHEANHSPVLASKMLCLGTETTLPFTFLG